MITQDSIYGIHTAALMLQNKRSVVLANNLANVDTPGYLAEDMDVPALLRDKMQAKPLALEKTGGGHMTPVSNGIDFSVKLRHALQGSVDKNTVDPQEEKVAFTENMIRTKASMKFISGLTKSYLSVIKGE